MNWLKSHSLLKQTMAGFLHFVFFMRWSANQIFGVNEDYSEKEIRVIFRSLAKRHHPDRGGRSENFVAISKAYQILSDEKMREEMADLPIFDGLRLEEDVKLLPRSSLSIYV